MPLLKDNHGVMYRERGYFKEVEKGYRVIINIHVKC